MGRGVSRCVSYSDKYILLYQKQSIFFLWWSSSWEGSEEVLRSPFYCRRSRYEDALKNRNTWVLRMFWDHYKWPRTLLLHAFPVSLTCHILELKIGEFSDFTLFILWLSASGQCEQWLWTVVVRGVFHSLLDGSHLVLEDPMNLEL